MEDKLFFKASENTETLVKTRKEVFQRGWDTGFKSLDNIASFLKNYLTLVFSPPAVGKSSITLDILMAQAEMGRNVVIYSPEYRETSEIFNALIQCKLKKSFFSDKFNITDEEYLEALEFVSNHFVVIIKPKRNKDNTQDKMSVKKIFSEVNKASRHYKMKFDLLFIDPFNYVEKGSDEKFMDTQDYVLNFYDQVAEYSGVLGIHTIISAHTRDVDLVTDKETGKQYYPVLHPSTVMGGQSNFRAGFQILHYWRAPEGVTNPITGIPYPPNYNIIFNQKAKPYGTGKLGSTRDIKGIDGLYFDVDTYTMYEVINGKPYYRNEYYKEGGKLKDDSAPKKSAMQPNLNFGKDLINPF